MPGHLILWYIQHIISFYAKLFLAVQGHKFVMY